MSEGIVAEVKLGEKTFKVWFFAEPDLSVLTQPVNGPEHNYKLARLLRQLKSKKPEAVIVDGVEECDDSWHMRRQWLNELEVIEKKAAIELRQRLSVDPGEYL